MTPRSFGQRATDVTTENNCAGLKWWQHDGSRASPGKLGRRLQQSGAATLGTSTGWRSGNGVLGGVSTFGSWSTTYNSGTGCSEAAFSPQANSEGVHSLPRSGDFGVRSTDVTTVNSCAGMQWFQHDSSAQAPDELLRRRRFAPHLQAEPGAVGTSPRRCD